MRKFLFDTWYGALVVMAVVSTVLLGIVVVDWFLGVRNNIVWNVLSASAFFAWIAAGLTLFAAFVELLRCALTNNRQRSILAVCRRI